MKIYIKNSFFVLKIKTKVKKHRIFNRLIWVKEKIYGILVFLNELFIFVVRKMIRTY